MNGAALRVLQPAQGRSGPRGEILRQQRQVEQPLAGIIEELEPESRGRRTGAEPVARDVEIEREQRNRPGSLRPAWRIGGQGGEMRADSRSAARPPPRTARSRHGATARRAGAHERGSAGMPAPWASRLAAAEVRNAVLPARASPVTPTRRTAAARDRIGQSRARRDTCVSARAGSARSCSRPGPRRRR